ncbi:hypothetical protein R6Q59_006826 [Mikania micrantha]
MGSQPGFFPEQTSQKKDGSRENDWDCPKCGNVNFSFRTVCNMRKCNTPKSLSQAAKAPKWHPVPKLQTLKRTKTSSSGKYTTSQSDSTGQSFVNLNESDEEVETDMPPPPSPQHPPGRNKGKQPQASSSIDYKDTLETISEPLQKFVDLQEQKQYNNDMKLLWTPTDHLTGRVREMTEKTKERIMKRYNMD